MLRLGVTVAGVPVGPKIAYPENRESQIPIGSMKGVYSPSELHLGGLHLKVDF